MVYDIVGENILRARSALKRQDYEEAFRIILETLRFLKPLSHQWIRLVDLAFHVVEKIEDTGRKCIAMLDLAELLRNYSYSDYERLVENVKKMLPSVYDRVVLNEINRRLERFKEETRRKGIFDAYSEIAVAREKIKTDPFVAVILERLYVSYKDLLPDRDRREIERLLKKFPPIVEFEIKRLSSEPLILPSKLTYEVTLTNSGYRGAECVRAVVKLESQSMKDEKIINLDLDGLLSLRPNERKTVTLHIPVDVPDKYKITISLIYRDALGAEYTSPTQRSDEIAVIMLPVSKIVDSSQLDELSRAKKELFIAIDNIAERLVRLYTKFLDVKKVKKDDFIDEFHREYRDVLFNVIEGELLHKLKKTRDAYRMYLSGFRKAINLYEEVILRLENELEKMESWKDSVLDVVEELFGTSIKLREEAHQVIGDLVRDLVKIKWFEDQESLELLLSKLEQAGYIDISDEIVRRERNTLFLLLVTKRNFDAKRINDLVSIIRGGSFAKSSMGRNFARELINCLKDLKVDPGRYA